MRLAAQWKGPAESVLLPAAPSHAGPTHRRGCRYRRLRHHPMPRPGSCVHSQRGGRLEKATSLHGALAVRQAPERSGRKKVRCCKRQSGCRAAYAGAGPGGSLGGPGRGQVGGGGAGPSTLAGGAALGPGAGASARAARGERSGKRERSLAIGRAAGSTRRLCPQAARFKAPLLSRETQSPPPLPSPPPRQQAPCGFGGRLGRRGRRATERGPPRSGPPWQLRCHSHCRVAACCPANAGAAGAASGFCSFPSLVPVCS